MLLELDDDEQSLDELEEHFLFELELLDEQSLEEELLDEQSLEHFLLELELLDEQSLDELLEEHFLLELDEELESLEEHFFLEPLMLSRAEPMLIEKSVILDILRPETEFFTYFSFIEALETFRDNLLF